MCTTPEWCVQKVVCIDFLSDEHSAPRSSRFKVSCDRPLKIITGRGEIDSSLGRPRMVFCFPTSQPFFRSHFPLQGQTVSNKREHNGRVWSGSTWKVTAPEYRLTHTWYFTAQPHCVKCRNYTHAQIPGKTRRLKIITTRWPLHFFSLSLSPVRKYKIWKYSRAGPHLNAWLVEWKKAGTDHPSREENRGPALRSQLASERAHFLPVRPPQVNFTLLKLNNPVTFSVIVSMGGPKNADHSAASGENQFCARASHSKFLAPGPFRFDYFLFWNLSPWDDVKLAFYLWWKSTLETNLSSHKMYWVAAGWFISSRFHNGMHKRGNLLPP